MKQILRAFLFLLLFTATVNTAIADEKANVTKQGTVRGRIIDATKQTLPGASIYIEKLHTGVTSDVNGFYTFSNLDPGTYTVKVSYVGYSPVELKITIPAGRTLEKDVVLNEGVELQEVVVGGAFQGQRRAINSQKNNMGITNVVSADQVGKFPDSNIGDALKRISGINVQYECEHWLSLVNHKEMVAEFKKKSYNVVKEGMLQGSYAAVLKKGDIGMIVITKATRGAVIVGKANAIDAFCAQVEGKYVEQTEGESSSSFDSGSIEMPETSVAVEEAAIDTVAVDSDYDF